MQLWYYFNLVLMLHCWNLHMLLSNFNEFENISNFAELVFNILVCSSVIVNRVSTTQVGGFFCCSQLVFIYLNWKSVQCHQFFFLLADLQEHQAQTGLKFNLLGGFYTNILSIQPAISLLLGCIYCSFSTTQSWLIHKVPLDIFTDLKSCHRDVQMVWRQEHCPGFEQHSSSLSTVRVDNILQTIDRQLSLS